MSRRRALVSPDAAIRDSAMGERFSSRTVGLPKMVSDKSELRVSRRGGAMGVDVGWGGCFAEL